MSIEKNNNQNTSEDNKQKIEDIINSKNEGKQYLEGEIHKEFPENQIDSNLTENNIIKEGKPINHKNYFLKDKISKMKLSKNITLGINKSMDKQMKNIEEEIYGNKILMTEIPNNLSNILSQSLQKKKNLSNYEGRNKMKMIKELKEEKDGLNIKLQKLISNEKFLEKEGYMQGEGDSSPKNFSPVDQKVYENKKKLINEKKSKILEKLEQIEERIKDIIENGEDVSRKERLKNYIENFEKDKEIIEARAKKYYMETKERNQRIANDLNNKAEKLKKEIDEKIKEEELKKAEMFKKLKDQEKATLQKRTKINDEKANKYKPFLNKKFPKENLKQYLFVKKYEEFQLGEKNLVDKENIKRKEKMKMDFNEINEFENNYISNKEKFENENAEMKKKLMLEWKERKGLLPTYVCPKQELVQEELQNDFNNEENKKERNLALNKKRYLFGYDIKNNMQPEINKKLEKKRVDLIKSLENPKMAVKEKLFMKRKKKAEEEEEKKDNANIKNNKSKTPSKLKLKKNELINKLDKPINPIELIKKPSPPIRIVYPLHPKPQNKIDYLNELRLEKEKQKLKRNSLSTEKDDREGKYLINSAKWEKTLNSEKGTFMEKVNYVKEKARIMDNEIKKNEKILNLYGGGTNNPQIRQKISNLLINSIEAKLSILDKFNEV